MTPDTPPVPIAKLAHEGERLRRELLDALRRADSPAGKAAVVTEMVMLYGQAFERVYDATIRDPSPEPLTVRVMHECVCGLAVYRLWLLAETPVDAGEDYGRMTAHWAKVTGWVLTEGE
jgi:hypothetical protein